MVKGTLADQPYRCGAASSDPIHNICTPVWQALLQMLESKEALANMGFLVEFWI